MEWLQREHSISLQEVWVLSHCNSQKITEVCTGGSVGQIKLPGKEVQEWQLAIGLRNLRKDKKQSDMDGIPAASNIDTDIVVPHLELLLGVYHLGVCCLV